MRTLRSPLKAAVTLTFQQALTETQAALESADVWCGHGYDSAHDEAVALMLAAAELPVSTGTEILSELMSDDQYAQLAEFTRLRTEQRLPTAYIIGRSWLGPLEFLTDARALIPRSPLMEVIGYGFEPWWSGGAVQCIVDVCCGGGSLGLLAAHEFPDAQVRLLDLDCDALALAQENLDLHGFDNVTLTQGDLLAPLTPASADIILANPPYVDAEDMASLPPEYLHEPRLALAAGHDGLDLVHRLLLQAAYVLRPGGVLFLEVGNSWLALEQAYPETAFTWLMFESGGHGVCTLSHSDLQTLRTHAERYAQRV